MLLKVIYEINVWAGIVILEERSRKLDIYLRKRGFCFKKGGEIYLWIEDREGKSSYTFWKTMMTQIAPDVIVESKKNNSELVKAVKQLKDECSLI